jgi:hypothetical protein
MTPFTIFRVAAMGAIATFGMACVVETSDPDPPRPVSTVQPEPAPSGSGSASTGSSGTPILVVVDTNKTMTAAPGDGVGIFTEYSSGGHWYVWWTCDSSSPKGSHQPCAFDVQATVQTGAISNAKPDNLSDLDALTVDPKTVHLTTTTSTTVQGVFFDTKPGASIVLRGTIGGVADPSFFFFVQDGVVNGGFQGTLSNPLELQGSAP